MISTDKMFTKSDVEKFDWYKQIIAIDKYRAFRFAYFYINIAKGEKGLQDVLKEYREWCIDRKKTRQRAANLINKKTGKPLSENSQRHLKHHLSQLEKNVKCGKILIRMLVNEGCASALVQQLISQVQHLKDENWELRHNPPKPKGVEGSLFDAWTESLKENRELAAELAVLKMKNPDSKPRQPAKVLKMIPGGKVSEAQQGPFHQS